MQAFFGSGSEKVQCDFCYILLAKAMVSIQIQGGEVGSPFFVGGTAECLQGGE